jgi:hypothetical protein
MSTATQQKKVWPKADTYCHTCGKDRGPLTPLRGSWGFMETAEVPRTPEPERKPIQMINDLIVAVSIYRNGGCAETTHLCDDCLRIGLRHVFCVVSRMLEDTQSPEYQAATEIAELTERLGDTQSKLNNLTHDHNRMQDRLRAVLALVPNTVATQVDVDVVKMAHWEAHRESASYNWQVSDDSLLPTEQGRV